MVTDQFSDLRATDWRCLSSVSSSMPAQSAVAAIMASGSFIFRVWRKLIATSSIARDNGR
jgi:hypothetical protein